MSFLFYDEGEKIPIFEELDKIVVYTLKHEEGDMFLNWLKLV